MSRKPAQRCRSWRRLASGQRLASCRHLASGSRTSGSLLVEVLLAAAALVVLLTVLEAGLAALSRGASLPTWEQHARLEMLYE